MSEDATLFGDEPTHRVDVAPAIEELPDWQVAALRSALDKAGVSSMDDRKSHVESIVGRPVASLRALTFAEAGLLREELRRRTAKPSGQGSTWDHRDEDTWIDRL